MADISNAHSYALYPWLVWCSFVCVFDVLFVYNCALRPSLDDENHISCVNKEKHWQQILVACHIELLPIKMERVDLWKKCFKDSEAYKDWSIPWACHSEMELCLTRSALLASSKPVMLLQTTRLCSYSQVCHQSVVWLISYWGECDAWSSLFLPSKSGIFGHHSGRLNYLLRTMLHE